MKPMPPIGRSRLILLALLGSGVVGATNADSSLHFDGVNDEVMSSADFDVDELTVEAWVFVEGFCSAGFGGLAAWGREHDAPWETSLTSDGAGGLALNWRKPDYRYLQAPGVFVLGEWHHVAFTYDGAVARIYGDGDLKGEATWGVKVSNGGPGAFFGINNQFPGGDEFVRGFYDEIRIWSVARSGELIREYMYTTLTGAEPGLIAYYRLDEGAGQIVYDCSDHGRHAVLGSSTATEDNDPAWSTETAPLRFVEALADYSLGHQNRVSGTSTDPVNTATGNLLSAHGPERGDAWRADGVHAVLQQQGGGCGGAAQRSREQGSKGRRAQRHRGAEAGRDEGGKARSDAAGAARRGGCLRGTFSAGGEIGSGPRRGACRGDQAIERSRGSEQLSGFGRQRDQAGADRGGRAKEA